MPRDRRFWQYTPDHAEISRYPIPASTEIGSFIEIRPDLEEREPRGYIPFWVSDIWGIIQVQKGQMGDALYYFHDRPPDGGLQLYFALCVNCNVYTILFSEIQCLVLQTVAVDT